MCVGRSFTAGWDGGELHAVPTIPTSDSAKLLRARLPDNPLGRLVADRARQIGVDVSCVAWSSTDRLGLYFVQISLDDVARAEVLYDRAGSAFARIAFAKALALCGRAAGSFSSADITIRATRFGNFLFN